MAEKKKPDLERREIPKQPPEVRRHNFFEVALGYTEELAVAEARRCIQCKKPQCVPSCPVEIDIPGFIAHIAKGDFQEGVRVLKSRNCLPAVCGRVCPQEEQCEKTCALKKLG
ncbi:MAG TPA: dihydropyrimidine dehydrogenase, partial [Acidobacteriota bacterium]|nr:dihydropyrimidine dehydrogenase [Acidobacteriota bacterium]